MYQILVVDDEDTIRNGVTHFINRQIDDFQVIATAENGEEAVTKAQMYLPDVIITDISMPKMNGLDFLECITNILPDSELIILSGYDNFEYTQQAMELGIRNYLLKPLDTEKLISILREFKIRLDISHQKWQNLLEYRAIPREAALETQAMQFRDAIAGNIKYSNPDIRNSNHLCAVCRGNWVDFSIQAMLNDRLAMNFSAAPVSACCFDVLGEKNVLVFSFPEEKRSEAFLRINMALTSISNIVKKEQDGEIHFFLSGLSHSDDTLLTAFHQAKATADYCFWDMTEGVVNYQNCLSFQLEDCTALPRQLFTELSVQVLYGSEKSAQQAANALIDWFVQEGIKDAEFIRANLISICIKLVGSLEDTRFRYREISSVFDSIKKSTSFFQLRHVFLDFCSYVFRQKGNDASKEYIMSEQIDIIIHDNMGNPNFSLNDIASLLFISPNYLRHLFKKATGITFVEYLTRARMKQAEALLTAGDIAVADVARQVGYNDPRYFSSCFKKAFGKSPSEYRQR